jgi:protein SCO1/2
MGSSVVTIASRFTAASAFALLVSASVSAKTDVPDPKRLPHYSTADFTAEWLDSPEEVRHAHRIAPFSFIDQDGNVVSNESLRGKIYVANFFFSTCRTICPRMAGTFLRLQKVFASNPDVVLVSHTVDPATDTQEQLQRYAKSLGVQSGKWHLLTGDRDAIYTLARKSYFAEKNLGIPAKADEFLHTENVLLVDKEGHIRGVYNGTLPIEASRIVEDVRLLEAEQHR